MPSRNGWSLALAAGLLLACTSDDNAPGGPLDVPPGTTTPGGAVTGQPSENPTSGGDRGAAGMPAPSDEATAGTNAPTGTGPSAGGAGESGGGAAPGAGAGGDSGPAVCSDEAPPDQDPSCQQWAEWGVCDDEWFTGYCDVSCGRCELSSQPMAGSGGASGAGGMSGGAGGMSGGAGGEAGQAGQAGQAGGNPDLGENPYPPIENGCSGYTTRYWDCCKPHCGWSSNVPGGVAPLASCNQSDQNMGGNYDAQSACSSGNAFMCHSTAPWAASSRLAYGYAAIAARGDICGRCYQLQFTGSSHNAGDDPGSAALAGKTMIVQATNVGGDVGSGQFDLLVPGGGVGAFNACSSQWGVSSAELGAQYGGFLTSCKRQLGSNDHQALKNCVSQRCSSVFGDRGLTELEAGCRWFVDWFEAADNPALLYQEVACPSELTGRGINRSGGGGGGCSV